MTPTERQEQLMQKVNDYFTRSVISHSDFGSDRTLFTTDSIHNFIVGDRVTLYDEMDEDNKITKKSGYDDRSMNEYDVLIVDRLLSQVVVDIPYDASVDITDLKLKSVFVYGNDQGDQFGQQSNPKKYPSYVIDYDQENIGANAAREYLQGSQRFLLTFLENLDKYGQGDNTRVKNGRNYVYNKHLEILELFKFDPQTPQIIGESRIGEVQTTQSRIDVLIDC